MANRKDTISLAAADISGLKSAAQRDVGTTSGNVMEVGAFGLGSSNLVSINQGDRKGFGAYNAKMLLGGIDNNTAVLGMPFDASTAFQFCFPARLDVPPELYLRLLSSSPTYDGKICKVYTDSNTTKAADGTLKSASPIVKVYADGTSETNYESEGVTVTRQGEGVYLITGCLGLNADAAWGGIDGGFDIPKDRNRQPLVWLDYEVNADGSVLVKTYHRTHPGAPEFARNEREGFNEGDPIDIPADQYVSIRVEMPVDSIWNQRQLEAAAAMTEAAQDEQPDIQQQ
ncbi:hypothetical protein [Leclercia sp.]|uniref:phage tail fiber protein n=1 Tax=Leclercia sp. TaxID=1898428 RepID=UPI00391CD57B